LKKKSAGSLYDQLKDAPIGSGSGMRGGFWKPKGIGDYVEGDVIRIAPGQFDQDVLELRQNDGSLINVGARRDGVLHRILFNELQVKVPGRVIVIYDGEKVSQSSGRKYRLWRAQFRSSNPQPSDQSIADDIPNFKVP
jgi:hypothetical protein